MNRLQNKIQVEETGCSIMSSESSILGGKSDELLKADKHEFDNVSPDNA